MPSIRKWAVNNFQEWREWHEFHDSTDIVPGDLLDGENVEALIKQVVFVVCKGNTAPGWQAIPF